MGNGFVIIFFPYPKSISGEFIEAQLVAKYSVEGFDGFR